LGTRQESTVRDPGGDDFDWSRFFRGCHPSADGYAMIAAGVARIVRPLLAAP
jgi:lysophospholipase L1-like esterase